MSPPEAVTVKLDDMLRTSRFVSELAGITLQVQAAHARATSQIFIALEQDGHKIERALTDSETRMLRDTLLNPLRAP